MVGTTGLRSRLQRAVAGTGWWKLRDRALLAAFWVGLRVLPAQPVAVVHGEPDWEGNAVEVVRGLVRRYPGDVVWLRSGSAADHEALLARLLPELSPEVSPGLAPDMTPGTRSGRIRSLPLGSPRALAVLVRAEATFFTHGLMTAVAPPRSRLVVNLWHGDGPKATTGLPLHGATVAVAATRLWGNYKADLFGMRREDVAVVGNPRVDALLVRSAEATRSLLGLDGAATVVVWLPTYRQGASRRVTYANGTPLSEVLGGAVSVPDGVVLLVKPHPMDTDDYAGVGARVVTDQDLLCAGATLVQLLSAADAVVSDASSAWVDSLSLDRPLGFLLPEGDTFGQARGYNVPDLRAVLPGRVLPDLAALGQFLLDVREGRAEPPSAHPAVMARIGYAAQLPVTDHLFDWLDAHQVARGRRPLFTGTSQGS